MPAPPKYAEILAALQHRIDHQQYGVGTLLPSESQLTREFRASRATVVRALRHLRRQGWVRGVQGKGRIVLGRPAAPLSALPHRVQFLLQADRHAVFLGSRRTAAPPRIAAALSRPPGTPVLAGRFLLALPGTAPPFGLTTVLVPAALTDTSGLRPPGGLLSYLERHNGVAAHRVVERLGARPATSTEAAILQLPTSRSLAVSLLTVLDATGTPLLAIDALLARDAPDLVATYDV